MKLMKRILAIVCTFVMIISMATGVNAVETTATTSTPERGKITVTDAIAGEDYKIYKILSLESYDEAAKAYSYKKPGGDWNKFIDSDEGQKFFKSNDNGYVTLRTINDTEARKLAIYAIGYAQKHNITPTKTATASVSKSDNATVVFENLDLGYYVVESTSGTACNITTAAPTAEIKDKHDNPSVNKIITGGGKVNSDGTQNSVNLGETVFFKTTINVKPGAKNYVLHDIMDINLIFKMVAYVRDNENHEYRNGEHFIVKPTPVTNPGNPEDGCTFELSFTDAFYKTYREDIDTGKLKKITVEYLAKVSENAPINTAMKNTTYLTYGDKNTKSEKSETETYTYGIPVFKYTGVDTALKGAKFILSTEAQPNEKNAIKFNINGSIYRYDTAQTNGNTTLTSDTKGRVDIQGLQEGTYYLKETEAPKGYNKIQKSIKIQILSDGSIKVDDKAITGDVKVLNNTGSLLPSTGGMGTTLIYVVGSILVLASGIVLFSKRKEGTN